MSPPNSGISQKDLSKMADKDLLENLKELRDKENRITARILLHLAEMDQRKIFREEGYSSLFAYLTTELGYSEPAAHRRLSAARSIARFEELYQLFLDKELSLTTLSLIAGIITEKNVKEIVERVRGKSRDQVQAVVSTYRPQTKTRDEIKPVSVIVTENKNGTEPAASEQHVGNHFRRRLSEKCRSVRQDYRKFS